jgi:hypothetical protein
MATEHSEHQDDGRSAHDQMDPDLAEQDRGVSNSDHDSDYRDGDGDWDSGEVVGSSNLVMSTPNDISGFDVTAQDIAVYRSEHPLEDFLADRHVAYFVRSAKLEAAKLNAEAVRTAIQRKDEEAVRRELRT